MNFNLNVEVLIKSNNSSAIDRTTLDKVDFDKLTKHTIIQRGDFQVMQETPNLFTLYDSEQEIGIGDKKTAIKFLLK